MTTPYLPVLSPLMVEEQVRAALLEDSQALGLQRLDARCIRLRFVFFFGDLARMNSNQIGNDLARALVGDCDVAPVSPAPS